MATVYTFTPRPTARKRTGVSLSFFQVVALAILVLAAIFFVVGGYLLFREYRTVRNLSHEVRLLETETAHLGEEYARLTRKELVLAKARALGLHPAKPEQVVRLP